MIASRYVEHASTLRRNNKHNEQKRIWIKNVHVSLDIYIFESISAFTVS